jgi:hypothetical protein
MDKVELSVDESDKLIKDAEIYSAHGRKEQAIYRLERALRNAPEQAGIAHKLHELKAGKDANFPMFLKSLVFGVVVTSIFSVTCFLVVNATWLSAIYNWPAYFMSSILGVLVVEGSGPLGGSIFFWVLVFTAVHFTGYRYTQTIRS